MSERSRRPNPVWLREMQQAVRLQRTPLGLALVTSFAALLVCGVGGVLSATTSPAAVGVGLFHTFFSLAFAVVAWVGPGIAAVTIASERSGRTWESLVLTGLAPRVIARGKLAAALTHVGLYLVMLAPVGALPFLFGGVTAAEVVLAFLLLLLLAALCVGFGLAVSSALPSPGAAMVVTLPVSVALSIVAYMLLGVGLSFRASELWPGVPAGGPIWLPLAWARAPFGAEYAVYLLAMPLALIVLAAWFFHEVTVANLADAGADRSSGLRVWFVTAVPVLTAVCLAPASLADTARWQHAAAALVLLTAFLIFSLVLFAGEPLGPSRRVRAEWERQGAGAVRRFLGPGIVKAAVLALGAGLAAIALATGAGAALLRGGGGASRVAVLGGHAAALLVLTSGFTAWVRTRSSSTTTARLLLLLGLFLVCTLPFFAWAILGFARSGFGESLAIAAPSPLYAAVMMAALDRGVSGGSPILTAGFAAMLTWTLVGTALLAVAHRCARACCARKHDAVA